MSDSNPPRAMPRVAIMCFFLDIGVSAFSGMSIEKLAEIAQAHGIDIDELIDVCGYVGERHRREAAALKHYRSMCGRA